MLSLFSIPRKPDWMSVENAIAEVGFRTACGEPRLKSVTRAFEKIPNSGFSLLANALFFQTVPFGNVLNRFLITITDPQIRVLCAALFPLLLRQKDGRCHLRSVEDALSEFGAASRWMSQQMMHSRCQSWFLVLLVPVVSLVFCVAGYRQLSANLSESSGVFVFLSAFLLYVSGCICLRVVFARQKRILVDDSLAQPSGQLRLLRALLSESLFPGGSPAALNRALSNHSGVSWQKLSRCLLFGTSEGNPGPKNEEQFTRAEMDFVSQFRRGYLKAPAAARLNWLQKSHRAKMQALKTRAASQAASLSLCLLVVMAIFFLPALFLMLSLSGMNFAPGTME
jgi:hypothetical protein